MSKLTHPIFSAFDNADIFLGLSGFSIEEEIVLGEGIRLRPLYAHLFAPFMMAFSPPASAGAHHPGPWSAAKGGFNFDLSAELEVSGEIGAKLGSAFKAGVTVIALLRIWTDPSIIAPVLGDSTLQQPPIGNTSEKKLYPFEVMPRRFLLSNASALVTTENTAWVAENWEIAYGLVRSSQEFEFALDALSKGQFIQNQSLCLVSLWAALEALFSPAISELKFRISALIASFLEAPGTERAALQKSIGKLYDKRSSAAHGLSKHQGDDLLGTFTLLRRVIIKIIDQKSVPSPEQLNSLLFGVSSA